MHSRFASPGSAIDPEALLAEAAWLRRLARGLVRSDDEADDAAQEAMLAAIERPPAAGGVRAWLAAVVRKRVARARRTRARLGRRERAAARPESLPATDELVARAELGRRDVAAVLELEEPYRTTVLLRYFDDREPARIARDFGIPAETVRTRLRRALALLRTRLDREYGGDRRAWSIAILPLAKLASVPAAILLITMSQTTKIALVSAASLLIAAAALVFSRRSTDPPPAPGLGAARTTFLSRPKALETPTSPVSPSDAEPPFVAADPPWRVEGTIVAVEPGAPDRTEEDGSLRVGSGETARLVTVTRGRFALDEAAPGDALEVADIVLGGRAAYLAERTIRVPAGPLEIRATLVPITTLRVVDAASGFELDDVTVLSGVTAYRHDAFPRDEGEAVTWRRGARSPIELPSADGVRDYWVHAPGRAWGVARVDHRSGGERTIALAGGARLAVVLEGWTDPETIVRVYPVRDAAAADREFAIAEKRSPDGSPATFDGLPAGAYQARAEIGNWWDPPHVMGRGDVALEPLADERLALRLSPSPAIGERVPLSGTIEFGSIPGAGLELRLVLEPLDRPALPRDRGFLTIASGRASVAWDAGEVRPGRYLARLDPLQTAWVVDVGPSGSIGVALEVAPLGRLAVRVVDAATGADVQDAAVRWSRPAPVETRMWALENARRSDSDAAAHEIDAPAGRLTLFAEAPGAEGVTRAIELAAGETTSVTLELERRATILLRFADGDVTIPYAYGHAITVTREGDEAGEAIHFPTSVTEAGECRFGEVPGGHYRLSFATLPGFEPIEPIGLEVAGSETIERTIELRRLP